MGYDSLVSDTEALTKVKLGQVDRTKKQLQAAMRTIGNLDERLTSLESMVQAALFKQQDDIKALVVQVNTLKGELEAKEAAKKFDMDAMPAEYGGAPPVGQLPNYLQYVILRLNTQLFFMEDEMIDLYEIGESTDNEWITEIEGVEEVFDPETKKLLAQF